MSKFTGTIGYSATYEKKPGVWVDDIVEVEVIGDITREQSYLMTNSKVNKDINIKNKISIVASPEVTMNFHLIKYLKLGDILWEVSDVEVSYPRLLLTLGGLYNG